MHSTVWNRFVRVGALVSLAAFALASVAGAEPAPRPGRRALNLFASSGLLLEANRVQCGLDNVGQVCVAFSGSPVGGGGFWPKGTPDQYIFNSGLQLAGIVDPAAGFAWAGDTAGAFFFDPRGDQGAGDALGQIFSSLDLNDLDTWPNGGIVRDAAIYDEALLGQSRISDGDSWVRYWEGNPVQLGGREHPMGIMVEQRSMAWNFPVGNEDILYFVFTFYNVSARTASKYAGLDPAIQQEVADIGVQFQDLNETKFGIQIPDTGYTITDLYAAFAMDADVAAFLENYSTAVLPFNIGTTYSGTFLPEVGWRFPSDIFGPPFFAGAGFVGVKYLKSPESSPGVEVGLTMFSNTTNSSQFPDAVGDHKLYRRLSGFLGGGDEDCTFTDPAVARARRLCFLAQAQDDARFYQASGPFDLGPGESQTIVVAYIHAAPVAVAGVTPGADTKPGIPFTGDSIALDPTKVRTIDRVMGWVSHNDANNNSIIEQEEVVTTPRSLLNKSLVAQAVFDAKFLLPNAPVAPQFFLVPGDNQTTVVWQKSETELEQPCLGTPPSSGVCGGDLFYSIASRPFNVDTTRDSLGVIVSIDTTLNALYDPNFRQFDVEGYRIYRGRTSSELELLAQFDYSGTTFIDYTGAISYGDLNGDGKVQCAPELGLQADCPVTFDADTVIPKVANFATELEGTIVQVKAGDRVQLANGDVINLIADTAVTGNASGFPGLTNTGVTFAYTDTREVRNGFTYHYAVTAFDVNSVKSGPTSLESTRVTKTVTPRRPSSNVVQTVVQSTLQGSGGAVIDPAAPFPAIDPATGTFTGLIPPANDGALLLGSAVLEALPAGDITARIDSIGPGFTGGIGVFPNLYMTLSAGGTTIQKVVPIPQPNFNSTANPSYTFSEALVPYDSAGAERFGIEFTQDVRMPVTYEANTVPVYRTSVGISTTAGRFGVGSTASRYLAHSRWWDATGTEPADPTTVAGPDSAHNAGKLTGVGRIWTPQAYRDAGINLNMRGYAYAQTAWYPADFLVTWNADSSVTVRDTTHRTTLPFAPSGGTGWGFVNLRAQLAAGVTAGDVADGTGAPNMTALTYHHLYATQPTCFPDWWAITCSELERTAQYQPLDFNFDGTADANGIALMINGETFIMEMTAVPAAGTAWRLRAVSGDMTATCAVPGTTPDCSGYEFDPPPVRPSRAPGLTYAIQVQQQYTVDSTRSGNLANVHTVPDPYYVSNALETTANQKVLNFVNLPAQAVVRIYSLSGVLVNVLTHNDQTGGGQLSWDLRNRNNQFVASGVYFYHVEGPDGQTKVGRFTIVNFAP